MVRISQNSKIPADLFILLFFQLMYFSENPGRLSIITYLCRFVDIIICISGVHNAYLIHGQLNSTMRLQYFPPVTSTPPLTQTNSSGFHFIIRHSFEYLMYSILIFM